MTPKRFRDEDGSPLSPICDACGEHRLVCDSNLELSATLGSWLATIREGMAPQPKKNFPQLAREYQQYMRIKRLDQETECFVEHGVGLCPEKTDNRDSMGFMTGAEVMLRETIEHLSKGGAIKDMWERLK